MNSGSSLETVRYLGEHVQQADISVSLTILNTFEQENQNQIVRWEELSLESPFSFRTHFRAPKVPLILLLFFLINVLEISQCDDPGLETNYYEGYNELVPQVVLECSNGSTASNQRNDSNTTSKRQCSCASSCTPGTAPSTCCSLQHHEAELFQRKLSTKG